jgi:hypothetical protein
MSTSSTITSPEYASEVVIVDLPTSISSQLTLDIVGRPASLHAILLPLLGDRPAPVRVRLPTFVRANGTLSKEFDFILALREHPQAHVRKMFRFRVPGSSMTDEQRRLYDAMGATDRQAYDLLYLEDDWKANDKACRNGGKAASKLGKRHISGSMIVGADVVTTDSSRDHFMTATIIDSHPNKKPKGPEAQEQALVRYVQSRPVKNGSSYSNDPDQMLQMYTQELARSNKLTPQMSVMLRRAITCYVAHQTVPIPMQLSSQSGKHPFYDLISHHAYYNAPSLAVNFEAVIKQLAMECPHELVNNLPGVALVPSAAHTKVRLPALIKTSFLHPTHGPMTAIALLLYMDAPRPERMKANLRGDGYERFFVYTARPHSFAP